LSRARTPRKRKQQTTKLLFEGVVAAVVAESIDHCRTNEPYELDPAT
jgi:hypothetical protein